MRRPPEAASQRSRFHYPRGMETLGDDLALLSVGSNGKIHQDRRLVIALAGSELVRLAARGARAGQCR